ncbi:MAG: hypothetical protein KY475_12025 [Planctomycetes bacterium]|nr:hypothetical protein [Planctomycetota bacterium]
MSMSLSHALQQVSLEPGRVYQCQVGNLEVEVRVRNPAANDLPAPIQPTDVMLDAWTDLPTPPVLTRTNTSAGEPLLPDPPIIPPDEAS